MSAKLQITEEGNFDALLQFSRKPAQGFNENSTNDWSETISAQNTTLIDVVCKVKKLLKTFSIAYKIASVWRKFETKLLQLFSFFFNFFCWRKKNFTLQWNDSMKKGTKQLREKKFCNNVYRNIYSASLNSHKKALTASSSFFILYFFRQQTIKQSNIIKNKMRYKRTYNFFSRSKAWNVSFFFWCFLGGRKNGKSKIKNFSFIRSWLEFFPHSSFKSKRISNRKTSNKTSINEFCGEFLRGCKNKSWRI